MVNHGIYPSITIPKIPLKCVAIRNRSVTKSYRSTLMRGVETQSCRIWANLNGIFYSNSFTEVIKGCKGDFIFSGLGVVVCWAGLCAGLSIAKIPFKAAYGTGR